MLDLTFLEAGQANQGQDVLDLAVSPILGRALHFEAEGNILEHVHVREQGQVLEDHLSVALLWGLIAHTFTVDLHLAFGRNLESPDQPQEGGLSASAGA